MAFLCLVEFLERNGRPWPIPYDVDEAEATILGVAAGTLSIEELTEWVKRQTGAG